MSPVMEELLPFDCLNFSDIFRLHFLQVCGGVFEALSKFFLKHELLSLVCLYFREFRLDTAKLTNLGKKIGGEY